MAVAQAKPQSRHSCLPRKHASCGGSPACLAPSADASFLQALASLSANKAATNIYKENLLTTDAHPKPLKTQEALRRVFLELDALNRGTRLSCPPGAHVIVTSESPVFSESSAIFTPKNRAAAAHADRQKTIICAYGPAPFRLGCCQNGTDP